MHMDDHNRNSCKKTEQIYFQDTSKYDRKQQKHKQIVTLSIKMPEKYIRTSQLNENMKKVTQCGINTLNTKYKQQAQFQARKRKEQEQNNQLQCIQSIQKKVIQNLKHFAFRRGTWISSQLLSDQSQFARKNRQVRDYYFVCNHKQPQSLIALKEIKHIKGLFDKKYYLWVNKNPDNYYCDLKSFINYFQIKLIIRNEIDEAIHQINQQRDKHYQVWASKLQQLLKITQFLNSLNKSDVNIIFFDQSRIGQKGFYSYLSQNSKHFGSIQIQYAECIVDIKRKIVFCRMSYNFLFASRQKEKARILNQCLQTMLNQRTDRKLLIHQFVRLAIENTSQSSKRDIAKLFRIYRKNKFNPLSIEDSIQMYTQDTFVHKLINRLLRTSQDPLQLFYIQPIFADLYNAVRSLNIAQRENIAQSYSNSIVCYRGATFRAKQMKQLQTYKKQNKYIQSLGFLSASFNRDMALNFAINSLIVIEVELALELKGCSCPSNFAIIQQYSDNPSQQQILFNHLSCFKIKQIKQIENKFIQIELTHIKKCCKLCQGRKQPCAKQIKQRALQGQIINLMPGRSCLQYQYWKSLGYLCKFAILSKGKSVQNRKKKCQKYFKSENQICNFLKMEADKLSLYDFDFSIDMN